jgi:membrane-bound lytic murein transglycosylase D
LNSGNKKVKLLTFAPFSSSMHNILSPHKFLLTSLSLLALSGCGASLQTTQESSLEPPVAVATEPEQISQLVEATPPEAELLEDVVSEPIAEIDMWQRIRNGFQFDIPEQKRIEQELRWYVKHPEYIDRVSKRGSLYLHHILGEIEQRDMPTEIALLPIVESAFDPYAYSPWRASGMWQIIPGTGKMLGLKQTWWYDGRRDVVASTDGALRYLEQLLKQFDGDWLHALAAYNSGPGRVRSAIRRNKKKGLPTDFWNLSLPRETRNYVPRLLALTKIYANPEEYGLSLIEAANEPGFGIVETESQIDLAQVAAIAGMTMDELYQLNPGFNRWASDPEGPHHLLVPADMADFVAEKLVSWQRYRIKSGDSLSTIAQAHNVTVRSLKAINQLNSNNIRAGKTLLVPIATADASHYSKSVEQRLAKRQSQAPSGIHRIEYTVASGDSLWTISRRYNTSTDAIARWNNMAKRDPIKVGQSLVIWSDQSAAPAYPTHNSNGIVRKVSYRVRQGDSLHRIADKFRVNVKDILRWNSLNPKQYLQPGQALVLFVDVTRS